MFVFVGCKAIQSISVGIALEQAFATDLTPCVMDEPTTGFTVLTDCQWNP